MPLTILERVNDLQECESLYWQGNEYFTFGMTNKIKNKGKEKLRFKESVVFCDSGGTSIFWSSSLGQRLVRPLPLPFVGRSTSPR